MGRARKPQIARVVRAAHDYQENLLNRNVLLVGVRGGEVSALELRFLARHFKHLTGVRTQPPTLSASRFFSMCAKGQLSERDLEPDGSGHAEMKLAAAQAMFRPDLSATAFGEANGVRQFVQASFYAGNAWACMGFESFTGRYYDPVTLLRSPVRSEALPGDLYRVVAVFSKGIEDGRYGSLRSLKIPADEFAALEGGLREDLRHVVELVGSS